MSANSARLKRMHKEAKRLREKHPNMKWATAMKEAGRIERGHKVSGRRKPANKKAHKKIGTKYRVTHHVEKIGKVRISGSRVSIGGMSVSQAKKAVDEKLAWELLAKDSARNVKQRKAAQKKITILRSTKKKLNEL